MGNVWPLGGHKHSERGTQHNSPPLESFLTFFSTCFEIWTWNLVYASSRWHDRSRLSFITIRSLPLHSVGCTTYWVHVSSEWGPCDLLHVLRLGTVNQQAIHLCWQTGALASLWLLLFICTNVYWFGNVHADVIVLWLVRLVGSLCVNKLLTYLLTNYDPSSNVFGGIHLRAIWQDSCIEFITSVRRLYFAITTTSFSELSDLRHAIFSTGYGVTRNITPKI